MVKKIVKDSPNVGRYNGKSQVALQSQFHRQFRINIGPDERLCKTLNEAVRGYCLVREQPRISDRAPRSQGMPTQKKKKRLLLYFPGF